MKVKTSILLVLLLALLGTAFPAETNKIGGEIVEYGTYRVIESKPDLSVKSKTGEQRPSLHIAKTIEFLNQTNRILVRKGTSFGFRYRLTNLPTNQPVALEVETIHPEFKLPDGKKDSGRSLQIQCVSTNGTWIHHVGYRIDDDFEMVEGTWTFSIISGNQKVLTKSFHVVKN